MSWLARVCWVALGAGLALAAAPPMSTEEVGTLEDRLTVDAEDLDARGRLLAHYFERGDAGEWGRHELWLVEHHPESDLHRVPVGLKDAVLLERLGAAWRKAAEDEAARGETLRNAAMFYTLLDEQVSLDLLRRARGKAPFDGRVLDELLNVYLKRGRGGDGALVERALVELENGQDAELLWRVGRALGDRRRGGRMMERAKEIDPEIGESVERPRRVVGGEDGPLPAAVVRVAPAYPEAAREKGVEGVVVLRVVIGTGGRVASIQLVDGHPLLVQAAVDAVKQWRFRPVELDGVAVEVVAQVEVPFRLRR